MPRDLTIQDGIYDGSSRVTNVEDPDANDTAIAYTSSVLTTVTDRLGEVYEYTVDGDLRVTKIKNPLLDEEEWTYNSTAWTVATHLGPKLNRTTPSWTRHKTEFTYGSTEATQHDLIKREVRKMIAAGGAGTLLSTDEWTYNTFHDELTHKDVLGKTWTKTFKVDGGGNSIGLIETQVNPLTQTTVTNGYDTLGNKFRLLTVTNGVSKIWTYAYNQNTSDSYGTPDKITDPLGKITNLKVDIRGRVYEETPPTGNTTKTEYDMLDRAVRVINPDGTARESVYDCCHLVAEIDENGRGSTFEHNVMGWLSKETNANGEETSHTYNAEGWELTTTDPRGEVTTNTFDDIGRVTQIDYPGGWQEIMTYFEPGMLKSKKSKKSTTETTVNYEYDDLYFIKKHDLPSGTDTEFEHDVKGQRTKMKDASGETRYTRDDAGRLTKLVQGPTGFTEGTNENWKFEATWNAASQITQKKVTVRTLTAKTWDFAYLDNGLLNTVTNPDSEVTTHLYLDDGRPKKITLSTGSTREFFYQDTNDSHAYVSAKNTHLRKTLDKKAAGTVICSFAYELDPAGNRLSVTDKDSKYTSWMLDPEYQLKSETKWSAKTATATREFQYGYAYDPNGNRIKLFDDGVQTSSTFGDNNEQLTFGAASLTYDHFGNTTAIGSDAFTWDFEGHMLTGTRGSSVDTHEYNGDGRRMRSKLNNTTVWTDFISDPLENSYPALLAEYTLLAGTFTLKSVNTHGLGLINTNREGTKRYFHLDGLGSACALTDGSEVVQDTYTWSAFGIQEATTGSSVNPFRYLGQRGYYDDAARGSQLQLVFASSKPYMPMTGWSLAPPYQSPQRDLWEYLGFVILHLHRHGLKYGSYCGAGSDIYDPCQDYGGDVDIKRGALDRCCKKHDCCAKKNKCINTDFWTDPKCKKCNKAFCECMDGVLCTSVECLNALAIARALFCNRWALP